MSPKNTAILITEQQRDWLRLVSFLMVEERSALRCHALTTLQRSQPSLQHSLQRSQLSFLSLQPQQINEI